MKQKTIKSIIGYLCFLLFYFGCITLVQAQKKQLNLTKQLQEVVSKDSLPGLAVTIVNAKGGIYKKGFGFANIQTVAPYSSKSIQPIGSVSKMILAVALMKATELGYFTLDTDINEILPFKVVNPYLIIKLRSEHSQLTPPD
ncbi:serine hydrolase domain-containing protein [Pedobacter gandavensis]|uniref:serine hydrolase domain-containing protein n=1 Tax=Pedobacter gandavensis TaxID=2679963 RepID=UPI00292DEF71|nr:serine hydrolase domain-containing protein [Pedobacter gandavensis]